MKTVTLLLLAALAGGADQVDFERQIKPILADSCYSCHGPDKQKSELRLDSPAAIQKGGKNGAVLVPGKPDKSTLYSRVILPKSDDDVMPSKGDLLKPAQTELIRQWIAAGAPFAAAPPAKSDAPAGPVAKSDTAASPATPAAPVTTAVDVLAATLPAPDASALKALADAGAVVVPISHNQSALSVDLSHVGDALDKPMQLLERVAADVLWLDLKGSTVTDAQLRVLAKLKNLQRLHLERTAVGDAALAQVKGCAQLVYLNLYASKVTDAGLKQLESLGKLANLYVWQSQVTPAGIAQLKKALPGVEVDGEPELPKPADPAAGGKKGKGKK